MVASALQLLKCNCELFIDKQFIKLYIILRVIRNVYEILGSCLILKDIEENPIIFYRKGHQLVIFQVLYYYFLRQYQNLCRRGLISVVRESVLVISPTFIKDTLLLLFLFRLQILSQSFVSFSIYLRRIQFKYRSIRVLSLWKLLDSDLAFIPVHSEFLSLLATKILSKNFHSKFNNFVLANLVKPGTTTLTTIEN